MFLDKRKREDWESLCLLIREVENLNGDGIYQLPRLKVGVYALSEGSLDNTSEMKIFRYRFDGASEVCMDDTEFRQDIISLKFLGLVNLTREKRNEMKTEHYLIKTTSNGKALASEAEKTLSNENLKALKEVAKDLGNENLTVIDLMNKHGKNWMEKYTKYLIQ